MSAVPAAPSRQAELRTPDDRSWLEFVESCPEATAFHHPAWISAISECYGFPAAVLVRADAGRVCAGLPLVEVRRRWISLPFTDHCPPLAVDEGECAALAADLAVASQARGIVRVEVHADMDAGGFTSQEAAVLHTLTLDEDPSALLQTFSASQVRRNIRKAESMGVTVRRADREDELTRVYFELHVETRRRQGVPAQSRRWFELLWRNVIEPGLGFLLLAYKDERAVAGAVFLAWNRTVVYKYGASDSRFWHLRANSLLFWEAIRSSCAAGHETFDFGRTDLENRGLREFKSRWGTLEVPLRYATLGERRASGASSAAERALAVVIRRSPPYVCRGLGYAFYRFAA